MQTDSRALARRHMWLSWWWGVGLAWGIFLVWLLAVALKRLFYPAYSTNYLTTTWASVFALQSTVIGIAALLSAAVRRPFMPQVFARSFGSGRRLLLGTALVFEGSVLLCWLLWELLMSFTDPQLFQVMLFQHLVATLLAFFGLSLPWLVSSLAAAWWIRRPHTSRQPN